jgi:hypothetical protein
MGLKTKTIPASVDAALQRYEATILPSRSKVTGDPLAAYVLTFDDPVLRQLFLIYFCALGVAMTEPVEDWIRRAGQRCDQLGLPELGKFLQTHAKHEAGHHLMMIEDTRALVAHWNATRTPSLEADKILGLSLTPGVLMYRQLHEDSIAGDAPFGQIAIEYEIEKVSVQFGPPLIQKCVAILGLAVVQRLSFIKEHMEIDVAHTQFNSQHLGELLATRPEFLMPLVQAGEKALTAYKAYIADVLQLAKTEAARVCQPA